MIKISDEKRAKLPQIDDRTTEKNGPVGSPSRKEFQAKAEAWYFSELLRDERKRQKLTQQELGERIGKKREYISSLEQGKTDMQLSTFMLIAKALGLKFSLVVGSINAQGKRFPSTVALNKLYYFMPYIKRKGIRDLYLIG